jgi:hypothetical protein
MAADATGGSKIVVFPDGRTRATEDDGMEMG